MDEAASRLRMQVDSKPEELDEMQITHLRSRASLEEACIDVISILNIPPSTTILSLEAGYPVRNARNTAKKSRKNTNFRLQ